MLLDLLGRPKWVGSSASDRRRSEQNAIVAQNDVAAALKKLRRARKSPRTATVRLRVSENRVVRYFEFPQD